MNRLILRRLAIVACSTATIAAAAVALSPSAAHATTANESATETVRCIASPLW